MTSPHSQALHSASLSRQKDGCVIRRWHSGTCFQMLPVCHVKEKMPNHNRSVWCKKKNLQVCKACKRGLSYPWDWQFFPVFFFFIQTTFPHLILVVSRTWSLRPSGIPMTSPAAICWISSAEWGETCSTPVSVISGGRTQVSHSKSFLSCPIVISWHSSVLPVTQLMLLVCCQNVTSKNAFLLSYFVTENASLLCLLCRPAPQRANSPDG